ncbi:MULTISPECIES: GNAT family N-acetyltransferase [Rhodomicrobium]|uniref:GNAT family N-acetyltransferase n=1 Tax=Rhodomicrobium TaxID=1068 RepID=UPI000B4B5DD5|nr:MULTISPECIES: GNAT family N-acetyltransferase [Rhodomicrobium]
MPDGSIEPIAEAHLAAVLALNVAHELETSPLGLPELRRLIGEAFYARGIGGGGDAFLIAFDQNADYRSPNFLWFRERFPRFVYIDRVITAGAARGRGYGRRLYEDLFAEASRLGHERVVCEVNIDPPNPASDAFHAALGFAEVGRAAIHGGKKTVRYFERRLARAG